MGVRLTRGRLTVGSLVSDEMRFADKTITTTQLLALNTTAISCVATPGAGKALIFTGAMLYMPYNSAAYDGVAAGEDLVFTYTDKTGAEISEQVETTGFLDQTTNQLRWAFPKISTVTSLVPVANAPICLFLLTGNIATGNSPLKVRVFYRIIPTTLA